VCNDLGFTWADQGRNLDKAAALIEVAVAEEPDNQSFLDSMGWVLYKQGRYDQAAVYLQKAIGPALQPDPVVLDHFGDVLYRLGRKEEAGRQWERSLGGLDDQQTDRADLRDLRQSLLRKLSEQKQGESVDVAPVVTESK
jgi:Tfp pilus assembly protein PilF